MQLKVTQVKSVIGGNDAQRSTVRGLGLKRIGDVVVACQGDTVVLDSAGEPPEMADLIGFHGSTTPAETAIPMLCFRGGDR